MDCPSAFRTELRIAYLFVHHLHSLRSLQFGILHTNLDLSFAAICLKSCFVPLFRMLFLLYIQNSQSLFDRAHSLEVLSLIGIILEVYFVMIILCFLLLPSLFDILSYICLGEFLFRKILLFFIYVIEAILIF